MKSRLILAMALLPSVSFAQSGFTADVLALNPLGFWPLNGNANDATTYANNGVLMNGVTFTGSGLGPPVGDPTNQAAVFQVTQDQYISVPSTASSPLFALDWYHRLTMMIWVKTGNTTNTMIFFAKEANSGNYSGPYLAMDNGPGGVAPQGSGRFAFLLQATPSAAGGVGGNFLGVEAQVSVNDGKWHFLVATYDGSGQATGIQLYVDGVAASTILFGNGNSLNGLTTLNDVPVAIGSRDMGGDSYDGLLADAAIFGTALSAAQVQQLENDTVSSQVTNVLPQLAFGGGWATSLYFTNLNGTPVSFSVNFVAQDGTPLSIPALSSSSTTVNLAALGSAAIQIPNAGSLTQGYVTASLPSGVTGYGVFSYQPGAAAGQQAVVLLSGVTATISTLIFDETSYTTGIAIVGLGSTATTVNVTAYNSVGGIIGTGTIQLAANGQTAVLLRDIPGLSGVVGQLGSVDFTVTSGNVAALGIRYNGQAFTSIPTSDR